MTNTISNEEEALILSSARMKFWLYNREENYAQFERRLSQSPRLARNNVNSDPARINHERS